MFTAIHHQEQGFRTVVGGSWLYHLEAYRRLFPPAYLATAKPGSGDHAYLTLWGQFLYCNGQLKPETVSIFTGCLQRQDLLVVCIELLSRGNAVNIRRHLLIFFINFTGLLHSEIIKITI